MARGLGLQLLDASGVLLLKLEHLRSVVGFRGYAQRDPLNEYKTESFQLFEGLLESLREEITTKLSQIRPLDAEEQKELIQEFLSQRAPGEPIPEALAEQLQAASEVDPAPLSNPIDPGFDETNPASWGNPGRNSPCPCGSGKKFKHCHGRLV